MFRHRTPLPTVLLIWLLAAIVASAATPVSFDFRASSDPVALNGGEPVPVIGTGSVWYDADFVNPWGEDDISLADGLISIQFNLFGQTFTEADDQYGTGHGRPALYFFFGQPQVLAFGVSESPLAIHPRTINEAGVEGFQLTGTLVPDTDGRLDTGLLLFVVPEPSAATLFALALTTLWFRKAKARRQ